MLRWVYCLVGQCPRGSVQQSSQLSGAAQTMASDTCNPLSLYEKALKGICSRDAHTLFQVLFLSLSKVPFYSSLCQVQSLAVHSLPTAPCQFWASKVHPLLSVHISSSPPAESSSPLVISAFLVSSNFLLLHLFSSCFLL